MGYFWDLAKDLPAGIENHPFYRIIESHYADYKSEDRLAFLAVKTSEAIDYFDQLVLIGVNEDSAREQALAAVTRDPDPTEEWEREDAQEETAAILSDHLARNAVQRLALQPGARKEINGKTYVLNQHHRWTLPHEAGQQPAKRPKPLPQAAALPQAPKALPQPGTPLEKWKETAPAPTKPKAPKKKPSRYLLESHLIDFVPQREPTPEEIKIAAEPGDSLEQRSARMVVSRHFLEQHGRSGSSNKFRVNGKLEGMDFSQPVLAGPPPSVPPPDALSQWQAPGGKMGSYFAPVGVTPSELGIGELTVAWGVEGSPIKPRVPVLYQFPADSKLPYLRSIAAPIVDNWGVEKLEQPTSGGGLQWFVPHADPGAVRELPPNYRTR